MIISNYKLLLKEFEDFVANEMRDRGVEEDSVNIVKAILTYLGPMIYLTLLLRGIKTPSDFDNDVEFKEDLIRTMSC